MSEETKAPELNSTFGVPGATEDKKPGMTVDVERREETPEERMARLRQLADIKIGEETDAEIIERLVAEAREKRQAERLNILPVDTAGFPEDYDKIEIYEGKDEHDLSYVPLSIGGFCIKAPRGVPIIIPHAFVTECLDHAVQTRVTQSKGGLILRSSHRFPYQFLGKATTEEYKAYQKEQKDLAASQLAAAA